MSSSDALSLKLRLIPTLDASGQIDGLEAHLTFSEHALQGGQVLATFSEYDAKHQVPGYKHAADAISVEDANGSIGLSIVPSATPQLQEWQLARDAAGDVTISFNVKAIDNNTSGRPVSMVPMGAGHGKTELRRDHEGVIGVGRWFLPRPVLKDDVSYRLIVEWELPDDSEGIRGVWSFGEGPGPTEKLGKVDELLDSVFMVGRIQSHPPAGQDSATGFAGTYWFGELPSSFDDVKEYSANIFPRMSEFFKDSDGSYRLFIRKVTNGFGGSSFSRSSIVEYDDTARNANDSDLVRLFNHLMVYSWMGMDPEDDGTDNEWYSRGFSMMYSVFFPFRFGQRTPVYFLATINEFTLGYYTNPSITIPLGDVAGTTLTDWYAESVPYFRGFMYVLKSDTYTRRASRSTNAGVLRPIDEIVGDIAVRRRRGEKVQRKDWIDYVAKWLGHEEATERFQSMLAGNVMSMEDQFTSFGDKHGPVERAVNVLEIGFDRSSLDSGVVTGVVPGSRAAEGTTLNDDEKTTGLQEGDRILWHSNLEWTLTDRARTVNLKVERNGQEVDVKYTPRALKTASCWQVEEVEKKEQ